MTIATYISLGLSILAAIGASYTYVVHTRRLNSQQRQINDYQLLLLKKENDERQKALLECIIVKCPGKYGIGSSLRIINNGKASGYNIKFETDEKGIVLNCAKDTFPLKELRSGQSVDFPYYRQSNKYLERVVLIWDDEF